MTTRLARQVAAFHQDSQVGAPVRDVPTILETDEVALQALFLVKRLFGVIQSLYGPLPDFEIATRITSHAIDNRHPRVDLADLAEALGQLDYTVEGSRQVFGIDGEPIADEIHRVRMIKVDGKLRSDRSYFEPKTWEPPKIAEEIERQCREGGIGKMLKQKP